MNDYTQTPYNLEVQTARGVLYLHTLDGRTLLRICRIPASSLETLPHIATIDLATTLPGRGLTRTRTITKSPVFLNLGPSDLLVESEAGEILLEVTSVPKRQINSLQREEFTDITIGHTT